MPTLDWIGKKAVLNHHRQVPYRLVHCEGDLSAGDRDAGNLLVQGDNLDALKALLPYYAGKVKCIFIDPPYNTGNENWVYNDAVNSPEIRSWLGKVVGREAEDLSRHDKWLCMMYPRLALMREFLSQDGAIFVSLDDTEVAALRYLMDELFGPRSFVLNIIWQKMDSPSSNAQDRPFSNYHDHVVVYARNPAKVVFNQLPKPEILDAYPEIDEKTGERIRPRQLRKNGKSARREDRPTMWYPITAPDGTEVWPIHPDEGWEGRWTVSESEFKRLSCEGGIRWVKRAYGWMAYTIEFAPKDPTAPTPSIWTDVGQNRQAKAQLNEILGTSHGFDTPKPLGLVERILRVATGPKDLILDSFAGSGTTGHAVLRLNKQDGGNRRFLLVEMDPKIAEKITAERLRRAVVGYTPVGGDSVDGLGSGFRFCQLGSPLFDEAGNIRDSVRFPDLAAHVFFAETGVPIPKRVSGKSPLLGEHDQIAVYLLFNGVLGDKTPEGGNILTGEVLERLPAFAGTRIVYGEGCRLSASRLKREGVVFKQLPYEIKVS